MASCPPFAARFAARSPRGGGGRCQCHSAFRPSSMMRAIRASMLAGRTPSTRASASIPRSRNANSSARTETDRPSSARLPSAAQPLRAGRTPFCVRKDATSFPPFARPEARSRKFLQSALSNGSRLSIRTYLPIGHLPLWSLTRSIGPFYLLLLESDFNCFASAASAERRSPEADALPRHLARRAPPRDRAAEEAGGSARLHWIACSPGRSQHGSLRDRALF